MYQISIASLGSATYDKNIDGVRHGAHIMLQKEFDGERDNVTQDVHDLLIYVPGTVKQALQPVEFHMAAGSLSTLRRRLLTWRIASIRTGNDVAGIAVRICQGKGSSTPLKYWLDQLHDDSGTNT